MKRRALWRYLWSWTLMALGVAWVTLVAASYYAGFHEADEITDGQLVAAANLLLQVPAVNLNGLEAVSSQALRAASTFSVGRVKEQEHVQTVSVLVWERGRLVMDSHEASDRVPDGLALGYSTVNAKAIAGTRVDRWRIFVAERPDTGRRVAVMIDLDRRARLAKDIALKIARPALVVLPLVGLLLWWAIRRGLRPLNQLSTQVADLNLQTGQRLDEAHRFQEFSSTVEAINGLIDRLQAQTRREREFASDVAHELRTPLAAIALQAGVARQHEEESVRNEALDKLAAEALRGGHILGQLLDLARAQRLENDAVQDVPLDALAARVMAGFAQVGHDTGHELELVRGPAPVSVRGNALLLELALRNLIDNAIRHTPAGTLVCVALTGPRGQTGLSVSDNGPGIQAPTGAEGLGIGLRLVERIAQQHGAELVRDSGESPMTNRYAIVWPPP